MVLSDADGISAHRASPTPDGNEEDVSIEPLAQLQIGVPLEQPFEQSEDMTRQEAPQALVLKDAPVTGVTSNEHVKGPMVNEKTTPRLAPSGSSANLRAGAEGRTRPSGPRPDPGLPRSSTAVDLHEKDQWRSRFYSGDLPRSVSMQTLQLNNGQQHAPIPEAIPKSNTYDPLHMVPLMGRRRINHSEEAGKEAYAASIRKISMQSVSLWKLYLIYTSPLRRRPVLLLSLTPVTRPRYAKR